MRIVLLLLFFVASVLLLHRRQTLRPSPAEWGPGGEHIDFFDERRGSLR